MAARQTRMANFINYRMKIVIDDGRILIGRFMAFDKHMNVILGDCDEYRLIKAKGKAEEYEEKRVLGLTLLRGECIISLSVDAPPAQERKPALSGTSNTGVGVPAGRGIGVVTTAAATATSSAAPGLAAPALGVGAPPIPSMLPTGAFPPGFPLRPGMPAMPGMPAIPGMPGMPGIPGIPGMPGMPPMPPMPGMPPAPGVPGVPGMPGMPPGMAFPPGFPIGRGAPQPPQ